MSLLIPRVTLILKNLQCSLTNTSNVLTFCVYFAFIISFFVKKGEQVASVQDCERQAAFPPFSVLISTVV